MINKNKPAKEYMFPSPMAKLMEKIDQRTQYESSMLSVIGILLGMITIALYSIIFTGVTPFMKVMIGINTIAAFFFLSSSLVTTYQQYITYLESIEFMDNIPNAFPEPVWDKEDWGGEKSENKE